ncbi:MAG: hypothetical protein LBG95_10080 [Treponema sp.]|jgi:hypothetical protein|nr:hypothetical protein [Treponema sp.]
MINNATARNEAAERLPGRRRWIFAGFARKGVRAALALSCIIFAVYLGCSMRDPGFSDRLLFLLLLMLRYSALLLCAFSLFALGFSVHRLVHHVSARNILGLFFYFAAATLGAGFAMLNSMIIAASGGNG